MSVQTIDEVLSPRDGPWTEEDWLALPESQVRVELLDGCLIVSPLSGYPHQRLVRNLLDALGAAAPEECEVFPGGNVRVRTGGILIPDIVVLTPPGLDTKIADAAAVILVVEVTSPSNAWFDRLVKPEAYARARIPYYLRVDLGRGVDQIGAVLYALPAEGLLHRNRSGRRRRPAGDRPSVPGGARPAHPGDGHSLTGRESAGHPVLPGYGLPRSDSINVDSIGCGRLWERGVWNSSADAVSSTFWTASSRRCAALATDRRGA